MRTTICAIPLVRVATLSQNASNSPAYPSILGGFGANAAVYCELRGWASQCFASSFCFPLPTLAFLLTFKLFTATCHALLKSIEAGLGRSHGGLGLDHAVKQPVAISVFIGGLGAHDHAVHTELVLQQQAGVDGAVCVDHGFDVLPAHSDSGQILVHASI